MARRSSAPGGVLMGVAGLKMFRVPSSPVSANPRPDQRARAAAAVTSIWRDARSRVVVHIHTVRRVPESYSLYLSLSV